MLQNKNQVRICVLMILSFLLTCNEARRISREKLARLLGQNPAVGFHHESIVHKQEKLKGRQQNLDRYSYKCIFV